MKSFITSYKTTYKTSFQEPVEPSRKEPLKILLALMFVFAASTHVAMRESNRIVVEAESTAERAPNVTIESGRDLVERAPASTASRGLSPDVREALSRLRQKSLEFLPPTDRLRSTPRANAPPA